MGTPSTTPYTNVHQTWKIISYEFFFLRKNTAPGIQKYRNAIKEKMKMFLITNYVIQRVEYIHDSLYSHKITEHFNSKVSLITVAWVLILSMHISLLNSILNLSLYDIPHCTSSSCQQLRHYPTISEHLSYVNKWLNMQYLYLYLCKCCMYVDDY